MSVYDKAHELARAISQSNEYLDLKNAFERIENDEEAKNMYKNFREKQIELQLEKMAGKNIEEKTAQLEKLVQVLSFNEDLRHLLESEARFAILASDVQEILGKALDLKLEDW